MTRRRLDWSLAGRGLATAVCGMVPAAITAVVTRDLGAPGWVAVAVATAVGLAAAGFAAAAVFNPFVRVVRALRDGVEGFREGDFSLRLGVARDDEIGDLVSVYNDLAEIMARERGELRQRELMLASVLEATPTAVLLVNPVSRLLVANRAARQLLAGGGRLEGRTLEDVAASAPPALREAVVEGDPADGLVHLRVGEEEETLQVSRHTYVMNSRTHTLILIRRVTPELRRQEVVVWRRVIRVVGHEISNALAPIRSVLATGRRLVETGDPARRLPDILETIEGSAERLHRFVDGYRRVARLPSPRPEPVDVVEFIDGLRRLEPFDATFTGNERSAAFDPAQLQQVVLNLVRNSREAGSGTVEVEVGCQPDELVLEVRDRGPGMDPEAMVQSLVPFWTTKPEGTGVGLALCREIVEAHGGGLRLSGRDGGGLVVTCRLPQSRG